jgi:DNA-directed RNA polymerase subunit RPC12/RpoP
MAKAFSVEGKCSKCGGADFAAPAEAAPGSWIVCRRCGERFMTWGAYKTKAFKQAAAAAKSAFGKSGGKKM